MILVTAHRRENLGKPLRNIFRAIKEIVAQNRDAEIIFPVHPNPRVRELAREILGGVERVRLIEPLDYQSFVNLMKRCYLVLTDSGGFRKKPRHWGSRFWFYGRPPKGRRQLPPGRPNWLEPRRTLSLGKLICCSVMPGSMKR